VTKHNFDINYHAKVVSRVVNGISNLFFVYCMIIMLALILFSSATLECTVVGESMIPTYNADTHKGSDYVYVNKYVDDYQYSDIIVIDIGETDPIIKRVIGLGGDVIDIVKLDKVGYRLEINGEIIEEDYIEYKFYDTVDGRKVPLHLTEQNGIYKSYEAFNTLRSTHSELFVNGKLVVPEGHIFALGDNRHVSRDSTYYGTFASENILGVVESSRNADDSEFWFYVEYILEGKFVYTIKNCLY